MDISWTIEKFEQIESTQEQIKKRGTLGKPEGLVVQALSQTGGKGRHGRKWESPPGNLYLSVLLRPLCPVQDIGQLSLLVGVAVAATLKMFLRNPKLLLLKWPNDVLLDGRKCAGLLLETDISKDGLVNWVALGVGVNVSDSPLDTGACLNDCAEELVPLDRLRDVFLQQFETFYEMWKREGFEPIRTLWLAHAHKPDTPVSVKIGSDLVQGAFHTIDEQGNLLLHDGQYQLKTITAGEVHL